MRYNVWLRQPGASGRRCSGKAEAILETVARGLGSTLEDVADTRRSPLIAPGHSFTVVSSLRRGIAHDQPTTVPLRISVDLR